MNAPAPELESQATSVGTCRDCGALILWVQRENLSFHQPLDMETSAKRFVIDIHGVPTFVDTYEIHNCRSARRKTGPQQPSQSTTTRPARAPKRRRSADPDEERMLQRLDDIYEAAKKVPCPGCGAAVDQACASYDTYPYREITDGPAIHGARYPCRARVALTSPAELRPDETVEALLHRAEHQLQQSIRKAHTAVRNREAQAVRDEQVIRLNSCPECGASRRVPCWNMMERRRGNRSHIVHPHLARRELQREKDERVAAPKSE